MGSVSVECPISTLALLSPSSTREFQTCMCCGGAGRDVDYSHIASATRDHDDDLI